MSVDEKMSVDDTAVHPPQVAEANQRSAERLHDRLKEFELFLMEASTRDAQEAMKVTLAINGGAAIAVLAFIGSLGSRSIDTLVKLIPVAYSLFFFAGGVFAASLTAACAYFANNYYAADYRSALRTWEYPYMKETKESKRYFHLGRICNWGGIISAVMAPLAFVVGLIIAGVGLAHLTLVSGSELID